MQNAACVHGRIRSSCFSIYGVSCVIVLNIFRSVGEQGIMTERQTALRALWRERIHLDPNVLVSSPQEVQKHFETAWNLVEAYLLLLAPLPSGLITWWLTQAGGHIVISALPSRYLPGTQTWRNQSYANVVFIAAQDLLGTGKAAFRVTIHLLDHLLGCGAHQERASLSQGYGLTPDLAKAAQRYKAIEQLKYGHIELDVTGAEDYLAETLWLALYERQTLNRIDPLIERLYFQTLLNERFWINQIELKPGAILPINHTPEPL
jgi:hypothetical protein